MLAWINWIRCLAILEVIAIHSSHNFLRGQAPNLEWTWLAAAGVMSVARSCVPIFVMVSGYLAGLKYKGWKDFYSKKLFRVVFPFVIWFVIYRLTNSYDYHFWFVYMIVPLYILAPVFIWIIKNLDKKIVWLLIVILFVGKLGGYAGYFLLGPLLGQIKMKRWQSLMGMIIISTLLSFVTISNSLQKGVLLEEYWDYLNPIVIILSIFVFLFFCNTNWNKNPLVGNLATNSYGIYLIHLLFLERLLFYPPPLIFLCTLGLSWVIVFYLKKIPGGNFLFG